MSETKEIAVEYKVNEADTVKLTPATVRNYLVSGDGDAVTNQEIVMFLQLCRYRRLNPFLKEAHLIKYSNAPATIVTGRDVFTKRAAAHDQYDGMESGLHLQNEEGAVLQRAGSFRLPNESIVGAWARVYRKDWSHPTTVEVAFDEYVGRKKSGEINRQWSEKPATMILKVAEVQALRKAFPEEFSGLYDEAENAPIDHTAMGGDATGGVQPDTDDGQKSRLEELRAEYLRSLEGFRDEGVITTDDVATARQYLSVPKDIEKLQKAWAIIVERTEAKRAELVKKPTGDDVEDAVVVEDTEEFVEDESQQTLEDIY